MTNKNCTLILGQGLAGTCLALRLAMEGRNFHIICSPDHDCASEKAAGLMNPVTGKRMALTWNYDLVWPLAMDFYKRALSILAAENQDVFSGKTIRKALHSKEEMNFLEAKSAWAGFGNLIRIESTKNQEPIIFDHQVGWAVTNAGARLKVPEFLDLAKGFFQQHSAFSEVIFNKEELVPENDGWNYKGNRYSAVVSCLGLGCPWIAPELWAVKGQLFFLQGLPDWGKDIIKTAHFLVPLENGLILAGSTYEREFEQTGPDEAGFQLITGDILPEIRNRIQVSESRTGIRPTTHDRRPVIRQTGHRLFAINGLGSKGVSLAPFAADQLLPLLP